MEKDQKRIEDMLNRGEISERQAELLRMDLREVENANVTLPAPGSTKNTASQKYLIGIAILAVGAVVLWKMLSPKNVLPQTVTEIENTQVPDREEPKPIEVEEPSQELVLPKIVKVRTDSVLKPIVQFYALELKQLYEEHLLTHPGLEGKVILKIGIMPSGKLEQVKIISSTTNSSAFDDMILKAARKWKFGPARSQEIIDLTVPFDFSE